MKDDRGDSGENIAGHTGTQPITQSIDRWYAEEKDYDYKNAKFSGIKTESNIMNFFHFSCLLSRNN